MNRFNAGTFLLLATALLFTLPNAARAAESYDNCTGFISTLPAVITTQGTWCLKQDLTTGISSGNAITINTDHVTIDCNDFKLGGLAAGLATQAYGIYADTRVGETVRHCNVRGFRAGILMVNTGGTGGRHLIEDNLLGGNTRIGVSIAGNGTVVRRNRVFDTGGSTVVASAIGIITNDSADIVDNLVSNVTATAGGNGFAEGIYTYNGTAGSISRNRIRGVVADGTGIATGIVNVSNGRLFIRNNDLVGNGIAGSVGLSCDNSSTRTKGNVISAFATGISTCANDGNVIRP
jgi:hypothetical protein